MGARRFSQLPRMEVWHTRANPLQVEKVAIKQELDPWRSHKAGNQPPVAFRLAWVATLVVSPTIVWLLVSALKACRALQHRWPVEAASTATRQFQDLVPQARRRFKAEEAPCI